MVSNIARPHVDCGRLLLLAMTFLGCWLQRIGWAQAIWLAISGPERIGHGCCG